MGTRSKKNMITDLDASDTQQEPENHPKQDANQHRKTYHKKRDKTLQTISGNFSRRSRSVECHVGPKIETTCVHKAPDKQKKLQQSFQEVLQAKQKHIEELVQRLGTLHKYNEEFSYENERLKREMDSMDGTILSLQKDITDCPHCQKLKKQIKSNVEEKKSLNTDIDMMKTLVFRLNVQIENYQDRFRQMGVQETDSSSQFNNSNNKKTPSISKWKGSVHSQTLRPLFDAYDAMIKEKEDLINQYRKEYEDFSGHLKTVLEENNHLHQQLEAVKNEASSWREEKVRLQAQLNVCRGKAEYHAQKTDLAKEKLVEVMHCYEQKNQSLALELDHIQSAYVRCKAELTNLKTINALPKDNIAASLKECKNLLQELKEQHNKEKHALEETIVELNKKLSESELEMEKLKHENFNLKMNTNKDLTEVEELRERIASLQRSNERCKRSRDRLKARLRISLQWAQKLEEGQANIQGTWDALKRLETIVKHKEAQVRGLHERHLIEIDKMEKKLAQKEETIRAILKSKVMKPTV